MSGDLLREAGGIWGGRQARGSRFAIALACFFCISFPGTLSAQANPKKKPAPVNGVNGAYEAIKERRQKIVEDYLGALFLVADECVAKNLQGPGNSILGRILKVVEPPENRRKMTGQAAPGVGLEEHGERQEKDKDGNLEEVKQKPLSAEEAKRLKEVKESVAAIRERLRGAVQQPPAPPPLANPPGGGPPKGGPKKAVPAEPNGAPPAASKNSKEAKAARDAATAIEDKEKKARGKLMKGVEGMANQCLDQGFPAHAYELLLWAIDLDPDNEKLRGYVNQRLYTDPTTEQKKWYSPYEIAKIKDGYVEDPEYGWMRRDEIKRLKTTGKLWYKKEWMPKDYVEAERQKWENHRVHQTEHFEVHTNASLRDVVQFGREIERQYAYFFRILIDFYPNEDQKKLVFGGGMKLPNKLKLHYYRSRESFLTETGKDKELRNAGGKELIEKSAGLYYPGSRTAYFYRGDTGPDLSVIYHEVTHQIFGETYRSRGPRPPTWLVEGFGVFMEDPVIRGERILAGVEPPPGIKKSQPRDINDFVKNNQDHAKFHSEDQRRDNYSTAGAAIHFFLLYQGGIYRQGFMRYAREAYRNIQNDIPTPIRMLYTHLGVSEEQLQADWETFNVKPDLFDF